jgi:phosphoglycolate phosphatase-like HAD superfamily hydrolase
VTANLHQPTLILWDIDRTLVTTGEVSREIYERAFEEIVGQPLRELADMAGRTEQAVLVDTLSLHGVTNPESNFDDF